MYRYKVNFDATLLTKPINYDWELSSDVKIDATKVYTLVKKRLRALLNIEPKNVNIRLLEESKW